MKEYFCMSTRGDYRYNGLYSMYWYGWPASRAVASREVLFLLIVAVGIIAKKKLCRFWSKYCCDIGIVMVALGVSGF